MSYRPTVNEPVEFETCVDKYLSFRASVNESWRGGGWRVSQQLIESEPGFIVVMGDLGYRSARSRIKRPEKLREIQLRNLRKYTYKAWKKSGKCCSCIWQSDKAYKPGCELFQMSYHSEQTTTFINTKKSD